MIGGEHEETKLSELPDKIPKLDQLYFFERDRKTMPFELRNVLGRTDRLQKARFLLKHAQKYNFEYLSVMQKLLLPTGITVHDNRPTGLEEIADKIDAAGGPYQVTDMVSVIIEASQPK